MNRSELNDVATFKIDGKPVSMDMWIDEVQRKERIFFEQSNVKKGFEIVILRTLSICLIGLLIVVAATYPVCN